MAFQFGGDGEEFGATCATLTPNTFQYFWIV